MRLRLKPIFIISLSLLLQASSMPSFAVLFLSPSKTKTFLHQENMKMSVAQLPIFRFGVFKVDPITNKSKNQQGTPIDLLLSLDAQKVEIDRRWKLHKSGKSKSYTIEEMRQHITAKL